MFELTYWFVRYVFDILILYHVFQIQEGDSDSNNTLEQLYVQLGSRAKLECRAAQNPELQNFPPPITYSWSKLRGQGRRTGISRHTSRQGVNNYIGCNKYRFELVNVTHFIPKSRKQKSFFIFCMIGHVDSRESKSRGCWNVCLHCQQFIGTIC